MSFETTSDILEHAQKFHRFLAQMYEDLSSHTDKQRMKMLLDYMSRHESHLSEATQQYSEDASPKIKRTWFQFTPCEALAQAIKENRLSTLMSFDEVVEIAVKLDDCLINIYRKLAESAESIEVREIFLNLLALEHKEKLRLVKNTLRLQDL